MKLKLRFPGNLLPIGKVSNRPKNQTYARPQIQGPILRHEHSGELITGVVILLMLIFLLVTAVCQAQKKPAITALKIGERLPDITISNIINYSAETTKIADFKGKLIIIDFWATWCVPCVSMIPKLDSLQKKFAGRLQILSVSHQPADVVAPFMIKFEKQRNAKYGVPMVTGDKTLSRLFPHVYLPHYVWINANGEFVATTGVEEVNEANISRLLSNDAVVFHQKVDKKIEYDKNQPFLINGNGGDGRNLIYQSLLSGYQEGLNSGFDWSSDPKKGRRLFMHNVSIAILFQVALAGDTKFYDNKRTLFEVKDRSKIDFELIPQKDLDEWKNKNMFCYDLILPPDLAKNFFEFMLSDLHRLFPQYVIGTKMVPTPSRVLVQTSPSDKLRSQVTDGEHVFKTGPMGCTITNGSLDVLVKRLDMIYMRSPVPVKNGTAIDYPIDLNLLVDFSDLEELNKALAPYDLQFVKKEWPIEYMYFKDATNEQQ